MNSLWFVLAGRKLSSFSFTASLRYFILVPGSEWRGRPLQNETDQRTRAFQTTPLAKQILLPVVGHCWSCRIFRSRWRLEICAPDCGLDTNFGHACNYRLKATVRLVTLFYFAFAFILSTTTHSSTLSPLSISIEHSIY